MRKHLWWIVSFALMSCTHSSVQTNPTGKSLIFPEERHFKSIQQLTSGGTNAEAYWSFDGEWLAFQHKGPGLLGEHPDCDQIYKMRPDGSGVQRLSNFKGRTTCAFFLPTQDRILFSSTFATQSKCPAEPDRSQGYVWPLYPTYQIYGVRPDGSDPIPLEPSAPRAYNAEATVCQDGSVIFTSDRDGDLNLYRAKLDSFGTFEDVKKITDGIGYDGGAVFSPDCKKIAWRASRPREGKELEQYKALLEKHLVKPTELEIWVANSDGSHAYQVTQLGVASFAPAFTPDGKRILFSSNLHDPKGHRFDLYLIDVNGSRLEQVTHSGGFDSFPMFSPDGKYLAFSSNRNQTAPRETNVFVAKWLEQPATPISSESSDPADRFMAAVQDLSAPEMEGRGIGTQGLAQSETWVVKRFLEIGLKPFFSVFREGNERDTFKMPVEIQLAHHTSKKVITSNNVLGIWGKGCGKVSPVLIGAHLDHLGMGSTESLEPNQSGLHPGADDNASGIAGLLEAARIIVKRPESQSQCFIFAAFTGEEVGIAGSSRLAELFKKLKIRPKAMLNLDMLGRMENNKLIVFGSDTAQEWNSILKKECSSRRLQCPGGGDGYGPSDHMAFYIARVPVLHFFTGPHLDYHRTSDTADKINATGGVQASEVIASVALQVAKPSLNLHFKKALAAPAMGALVGSNHKSKGAYLGTIPDYSTLTSPHGPAGGSAEGGGVKLAGTRPGSPADRAGVKEGDILKGIQGKPIKTLQEFTNVLADLTPGDKVKLDLVRNGKAIQLEAVVGNRSEVKK
jgi:Tol biopolymer transport system component